MILILGGTTEGRKVVGIVEKARKPYCYPTKGGKREISLRHGMWPTGALAQTIMKAFCQKNGIRLLMDVARPFTEQLHVTIAAVSQALDIPYVQCERMYDDPFKLFNEEMYDEHPLKLREKYEELSELFNEKGIHRVLVLTGVRSIPRLEPFWKRKESECYFCALDRGNSREIVWKAGFPEDRLVHYTPDEEDLSELLRQLSPEVILLKGGGVSGEFSEKMNIITEQGIHLYIPLRPSLPPCDQTADGVDGMHCVIEHFLPSFSPLHSGLTTGTCATVAVNIALRKLLPPIPGSRIKGIPVLLPNGERVAAPVHSVTGSFTDQCAEVSCTVIENGGDDPDVTNKLPIVTTISTDVSEERPRTRGKRQQVIQIHDGQGVGTVTLPGLGPEVGGPTINTTPRQMIIENLLHILGRCRPLLTVPVYVTISAPGGEEVAAHIFDPRLGVVGGISIIGASGIVKPSSPETFVNSIHKEMSVARAVGSPRIVTSPGAKSEKYTRSFYPELSLQASIHYGNFINEAVRMAAELNIWQFTLGAAIGKAIRLAERHLDTHSRKVTVNKEFLKEIARQSGCSTATVTAIEGITSTRELWELLPETELQAFCSLLIEQCHHHCDPLLSDEELTILSITEEGEVIR